MVYVGTDDAVWHAWYDGSWHNRESLGGVATSSPAIVSKSSGTLDVAVRGTDNKIWRRSFDGTSWGNWNSCGPSSFNVAGKPAMGVNNGTVLMYVRDSSNAIWTASGDCP